MTTVAEEQRTPADRRGAMAWGRRSLPPLCMIVAVLVGSLIPLLRNHNFYFWDDTAGVAVGVWQRIAEQLLSGQLPFLQLDMWRGGNLIAEAATGMWNPAMVVLMLATHPFDDVATAITIAKVAFFLIMAGGVYLLARSFTAKPWLAAVAGVVAPLGGWALFMNGTSWINEVAITAFAPWAWWSLRRAFQRSGRGWAIPLAAACGYLLVSVGDPYGVLALAIMFLAVLIESIATRRLRDFLWLLPLGAALLLACAVVYLPFLYTSSVGFRAQSGIYNSDFLSPTLSDLLGLSVPTFKPYLTAFGLPYLTFPGMYLAWFVLPLLPWLRLQAFRDRWRELSGVVAFAVFYLFLVLGPTQIWMFRWPARLIPFLYLAVTIVFVVVASAGWHEERKRGRAAASAALVLVGSWMAFSDVPSLWKWHAAAALAVGLLLWVLVRFARSQAARFAVLAGGMIVFLVPQVVLAPGNDNVADYNFPHSRAAMSQQFGDRYTGVTVQVANYASVPHGLLRPDAAWRDLLGGNMYSVAGVESTTAYSGIGFSALDDALCETYNGATCPRAWEALWKTPAGASEPLADLLRVETVVVQKDFAQDHDVPEGWFVAEETLFATVYKRGSPLEFPDGRLSSAGAAVTVESDVSHDDASESLTVSTAEGPDRTLTFARLAWPGYSAVLNGQPVDVVTGPAGLLQVELPPGVTSGDLELRFTPPGLLAGLVCLALGAIMVVVLTIVRNRRPGA